MNLRPAPVPVAPVAQMGYLMRRGATRNLMASVGRKIELLAPSMLQLYDAVYSENPRFIAGTAYYSASISPMEAANRGAHIIVQATCSGWTPNDLLAPLVAVNRMSTHIVNLWNTMGALYMPAEIPRWITDNLPGAAIEGEPAALYVTADGMDRRLASIRGILEAFALGEEQNPAKTLEVYASGILCYAKRGNVTQGVIQKVTQSLQTEANLTVNLNPNHIRIAWNLGSQWFNPEVAQNFFRQWEEFIGPASLRLRLVINQAQWAGMTHYTNIHRAKALFPTFNWAAAASKMPADFHNFVEACNVVRGNAYYGYSSDLGAARSTNYSSLCYLAHQLLVDHAGERTLRDYAGIHRNAPHAAEVDVLLNQFRDERAAAAGQVRALTAGETATLAAFHAAQYQPQIGQAPARPEQ